MGLVSEENKNFIKEKIVKKTGAGKGFRTFIKIVTGAVLFGVIAAGVFVVSKPFAEKVFGTEPESTTAEVVMIPRDENVESVTEPTEEENITETVPEETESSAEEKPSEETVTEEAESSEPVEDVVIGLIEGYQYDIEDLNGMWKNLSVLCNNLDPAVVVIRNAENNDELFPAVDDHSEEYSGIVIAETYNEAMILTPADAVNGEKDVEVVWVNGNSQPAYSRKTDELTGLAVVAVKKSEMTDAVHSFAHPISLGNSYGVTRGDLLIALGSPRGTVHSADYAWAAYIDKNAHTVDGTSRIICLNNYLDNAKGTWLLNINGELIGWDDLNGDGSQVIGISDYKSLIERMINSSDYAYIGIKPSSIPADEENEGRSDIPKGVYVLEVINGGPAYESGIQPGDIITYVNGVAVNTPAEYSSMMEKLHEGDEIEVEVQREARGEYRKLNYTITVGKRNE